MRTRGTREIYNRTLAQPVKARAARLVGVIATEADLRCARRLRRAPHYFELRLDSLTRTIPPDQLLDVAPDLGPDLILTARARREGGLGFLSSTQKSKLVRGLLSHAAFIDLELRSSAANRKLRDEAGERGIGLILSVHQFEHSFSPCQLRSLASLAVKSGAAIFKVVCRVETMSDIEALRGLVCESALPVSAAGVGWLGETSRRRLLAAGSALNYGYLSKPLAAGQLSLEQLRRAVRKLQ